MKCVPGIGIDDELAGRVRFLAGCAHALHRVDGNSAVLGAVEAEHRSLELGGKVERCQRARRACEAAVPRHAGLSSELCAA